MHSRFLECFQRSRLSVSQTRFCTAFGERPASTAPGSNQQELDLATTHPVANCGNLLAFPQLAELRQSDELSCPGICSLGRRDDGQT
jgi:hypothetical protein